MQWLHGWHTRLVVAALVAGVTFATTRVFAADASSAPADPQSWTPQETLSGFADSITALAFAPDGKTLVVGQRNSLLVLTDDGLKTRKAIPGSWGAVTALSFSPEGSVLAVGGYQSLQLLKASDFSVVATLKRHRGSVTGLAFDPRGEQLVSVSDDETALLWDLKTESATLLTGHNFPVNGVAWSRDGSRIITVAGDELRPTKAGEVVVRDAQGAVGQQLELHERAVLCTALSPNGTLLVTGGLDEKAAVYDLKNGQPLEPFEEHQRPVNKVQFLDEETVVSIGGGRAKGGHTLRCWSPRTGQELAMGDAPTAKILALAVDFAGKRVATGGADQLVMIWDLPSRQDAPAVAEVVAVAEEKAAPGFIRVGVIGLDTSHAPAFAKLMNDPQAAADVAGCRIVAAYPKGSPDIKSSTERVPGYVKQFEEMGIKIVGSIPELLDQVDCVLLETNDGRPHLEQVLPVLKAGKRCFIDKPVAGSLADAIAIYEASKQTGTPIFSSSSLRYMPVAQEVRSGRIGNVTGCDAFSPCSLEATHPDLFWYGIHGVEILFTVMGTGCESVSRTHTEGFDFAVGTWSGGRIGSFRGIRSGASGYGGHAFGDKGKISLGEFGGYRPLAVEIVKFFKTGEVPVSAEETLEIYAFMEAADESKRRGGGPVKLSEVMEKARLEAAAKN